MTFTDDDLKIMKHISSLISEPDDEYRKMKIRALIARLEAAEEAVCDLQVIRDQMRGVSMMTPVIQMFDGRELENADIHIKAWRKACGHEAFQHRIDELGWNPDQDGRKEG